MCRRRGTTALREKAAGVGELQSCHSCSDPPQTPMHWMAPIPHLILALSFAFSKLTYWPQKVTNCDDIFNQSCQCEVRKVKKLRENKAFPIPHCTAWIGTRHVLCKLQNSCEKGKTEYQSLPVRTSGKSVQNL